jgi:nucleoside-diphosphate-sugar epimerase
MEASIEKPVVLITSAAGNIGIAVAAALANDYRIVGVDRAKRPIRFPLIEVMRDHSSLRRRCSIARRQTARLAQAGGLFRRRSEETDTFRPRIM